ncbi:DUF4167 domain-containing protein [Sphingomonas oleivorans]|nr:DUF4167 domain-containing protein [Sphingomonas oleivorans]
MNNRQNGRRRGRGGAQPRNGQAGGPDRGNRLDNRARGNANQLHEKYKALARDAQMQGDRVNTEYYLQFADHYFRVLNENRARFEEQRPRRDDYQGERDYQGRDDFAEREDEQLAYGEEGEPVGEAEENAQEEPRFERRIRQPREGRGARHQAVERAAPDMPVQAGAGDDSAAQQGPSEVPVEAPPPARRTRRRAQNGAAAEAAPADAAAERIEIDRLPPSFSAEPRLDAPSADDGEPAEPVEEKPRRRVRRPRSDAAVADA